MYRWIFGNRRDRLELSLPRDRKPFWRSMSLFGWLLVFFGICSGVGFVVGLIYGQVFFILPTKGSHPLFLTFAFESSPFWYSLFMLIDLAVTIIVWWSFINWIKKRNKKI